MFNQPINVFTDNAPAEKNPGEKFLTREQAHAKEIQEKEELRLWWDDLPEEKRQEIRDQQFVEKKRKAEDKQKKPSKPKHDAASDNEEESKYAFIDDGADRRPALNSSTDFPLELTLVLHSRGSLGRSLSHLLGNIKRW